MEDQTTIKLKLPRQDFSGEPLFQPTEVAAADWVQHLPVTNTTALVQMLIEGLGDLNRTRLGPEVRFKIMGILLPNLQIALLNLSKRFLNQPLIMPEEPRRMADLSDHLLTLVATGYTIVAVQTIQQRDAIRETNPARLTCEAIHKALIFAGRKVLQSFQLHRPLESHGWQTLHQLYTLADSQKLTDLPVPEPLSGGNTIKTAYLQAVLIGCCKANQLRQSDLTPLYRGFQQWSARANINRNDTGDDLFLVDLDSDKAPSYCALYREEPGASCRYIDTSALVKHLEAMKEEAGGQTINLDKNTNVPVNLLEHLITSLGSMSLRNFKRTRTSNTLWICAGFNSTHYHVAGQRSFEQLVVGNGDPPAESGGSADNLFLSPLSQIDVWQTVNPGDYSGELRAPSNLLVDVDSSTKAKLFQDSDSDLPLAQRYPVFQAQLADSSPGGYCVEWTEGLPGDIKAGDIVGLKEDEHIDWVIAVIRWVSRLNNARTLIGLELLSPRAIAYGATIRQKGEGKPVPMRALLLPEIKLVGQPQTLITPRTGFKERQKITIGTSTEVHSIQLLRHIASTGSYSQFEFREAKELGDVLADNGHGQSGGEFDSLWSNI
jgi:cyclic-di-GMP-binding protein